MSARDPLVRHGLTGSRMVDPDEEPAVAYFMRTQPAAHDLAVAAKPKAPPHSEPRLCAASRRGEAMRDAYRHGEEAGIRDGFSQGLQWGLTVGAVGGALVALLAVALFAALR